MFGLQPQDQIKILNFPCKIIIREPPPDKESTQ